MESARSAGDSSQRLALQLQALSEIAESLTYRLLTVEERLAALDRQVQQLWGQSAAAGQSDDAALRLDETEERLSRLEALLRGGEPQAADGLTQRQPSNSLWPNEPFGDDEGDEGEAQLNDQTLFDDEQVLVADGMADDQLFCEDHPDGEHSPFLDDLAYGDSGGDQQAA